MARLLLFAVAIVLGSPLALAQPAYACSCGARPLEERLESLDELDLPSAVVLATAVQSNPGWDFLGFGPEHTWTFEVAQVVHGEVHQSVQVRARTEGSACGLNEFAGRATWWVLYRQNGSWTTTSCDALRGASEVRALGPGRQPLAGAEGVTDSWPRGLAFRGLAIVAIAVGAAAYARRDRQA